MPRCVGLITSPKGAVVRDMLTILNKRWPLASVRIYSAAVQGENAPQEMVSALKRATEGLVQVLIIGRGGGASEDLSASTTSNCVDQLRHVRSQSFQRLATRLIQG